MSRRDPLPDRSATTAEVELGQVLLGPQQTRPDCKQGLTHLLHHMEGEVCVGWCGDRRANARIGLPGEPADCVVCNDLWAAHVRRFTPAPRYRP